jgi:ketosteroid isomerase-like protein
MPVLKRLAIIVALLTVVGPTVLRAGQTPALPPSVELPSELARVLTDYEKAWSGRDARTLAALFTDDGFVLSNGRPPVHGRAAIEKHYTGAGGPLFLRAFAFATEGNVGYIIGGFATAKAGPDAGKFTLTLRKEAGRWSIVSDMDNGNTPR